MDRSKIGSVIQILPSWGLDLYCLDLYSEYLTAQTKIKQKKREKKDRDPQFSSGTKITTMITGGGIHRKWGSISAPTWALDPQH